MSAALSGEHIPSWLYFNVMQDMTSNKKNLQNNKRANIYICTYVCTYIYSYGISWRVP